MPVRLTCAHGHRRGLRHAWVSAEIGIPCLLAPGHTPDGTWTHAFYATGPALVDGGCVFVTELPGIVCGRCPCGRGMMADLEGILVCVLATPSRSIGSNAAYVGVSRIRANPGGSGMVHIESALETNRKSANPIPYIGRKA